METNTAPASLFARLRRRRVGGFTLLELIVVLVVLAILGLIAVPTYQGVKDRATDRVQEINLASLLRDAQSIAAANFRTEVTDADMAVAAAEMQTWSAGVFAAPATVSLNKVSRAAGGVPSAESQSVEPDRHNSRDVVYAFAPDDSNREKVVAASYSPTGHCTHGIADGLGSVSTWTDTGDCTIEGSITSPEDKDIPVLDSATGSSSSQSGTITLTWHGSDSWATGFTLVCDNDGIDSHLSAGVSSGETSGLLTGAVLDAEYTCYVQATDSTASLSSNTLTATATFNIDLPGGPEVAWPPDDCVADNSCPAPPAPSNALTVGAWSDLVSLTHPDPSPPHRLFFSDYANNQILRIVDHDPVDGQGTGQTESELFAGSGVAGYADGVATAARFDGPAGLFIGSDPFRSPSETIRLAAQNWGNLPPGSPLLDTLYVADKNNNAIRAIDLREQNANYRNVHTVVPPSAGIAGPVAVAGMTCYDMTTGAAGDNDCLYVATSSGELWQADLVADTYTQVYSGLGVPSDLYMSDLSPTGTTGAWLWMPLQDSDKIVAFELDAAGWPSTDVVGSGVAGSDEGVRTAATMNAPGDAITVDMSADPARVYFTDTDNSTVRFMDLSSGQTSLLAGQAGVVGFDDGIGAAATFDHPRGAHFHGNEPYIYVLDVGNDAIRKIDVASGRVTTLWPAPPAATEIYTARVTTVAPLSVTNGDAGAQQLAYLDGKVYYSEYNSDNGHYLLRSYDTALHVSTTVADSTTYLGNGWGTDGTLLYGGVGYGAFGSIDPTTGAVTQLVPNYSLSGRTTNDAIVAADGYLYLVGYRSNTYLARVDLSTNTILDELQVGSGETTMAISADDTYIYLSAGRNEDPLSVRRLPLTWDASSTVEYLTDIQAQYAVVVGDTLYGLQKKMIASDGGYTSALWRWDLTDPTAAPVLVAGNNGQHLPLPPPSDDGVWVEAGLGSGGKMVSDGQYLWMIDPNAGLRRIEAASRPAMVSDPNRLVTDDLSPGEVTTPITGVYDNSILIAYDGTLYYQDLNRDLWAYDIATSTSTQMTSGCVASAGAFAASSDPSSACPGYLDNVSTDGTYLYAGSNNSDGYWKSKFAMINMTSGAVIDTPGLSASSPAGWTTELDSPVVTYAPDGYLYVASYKYNKYGYMYLYRVDPESMHPVASASLYRPGSTTTAELTADASHLWLSTSNGVLYEFPLNWADGISISDYRVASYAGEAESAGDHLLAISDDFTVVQIDKANPGGPARLIAGGYGGADDGTGYWASFGEITDLTFDGTNLWVMDRANNSIRKIAPAGLGDVGSANPGLTATLTIGADAGVVTSPVTGLASGPWIVEANGSDVYFDQGTDLWKYNGATAAQFASIGHVVTDMASSSNYVFVAVNQPYLKVVDRSTGDVAQLGGTSLLSSNVTGVAFAADGYLYTYDASQQELVRLDPLSGYPLARATTDFSDRAYAQMTSDGSYLYIGVKSSIGQHGSAYRVPLTWADGATLDAATFQLAGGSTTLASAGAYLYTTDYNGYANTAARWPKSGLTDYANEVIVAGPGDSSSGFVDATGPAARFGTAYNNAITSMSAANGVLWVADHGNMAIRRIAP